MAERHLISLGFRCDVAFQLRMHSGDNTAHFFDWLALPARGVIDIIKRDFDVFAPEDLVYAAYPAPGRVDDRRTGTRFHHQFPFQGQRVDPDFMRGYDPFIAKFRHLAQRFRDYVGSRPVTLVRRDITAREAVELETAVFERFPGADVRFLYLVTGGALFETKHGHARLLAGERSVGDPLASAQLLREEGLIDQPFRLSTLDIYGARHEGFNLSIDNRLTVHELEAARRGNPDNPGFAYELARLHRGEGRPRLALELIAAARAADPDHAVFIAEELHVRKQEKQIDARAYAEGLVGLVGDDDPADVAKLAGDGLFDLGDFAGALRCYDVWLGHHVGEAAALIARGSCLAKLDRWAEAEASAAAGLAATPDDVRGLLIHSQACAALGRLDEAMTDAVRALELSRSHVTRYQLAGLYEQAGEVAKAVALYEEIEMMGIAVNGRAIERLAVLRLGTAEDEAVKPAKASWLKGLFGAKG